MEILTYKRFKRTCRFRKKVIKNIFQTDPALLQELGQVHDVEGDKSAAFQYHYDAYKVFPGDIRVIEWLSSYYIESQFPEKASNYFNRASIIEPHQVKWHLMHASCLRKIGMLKNLTFLKISRVIEGIILEHEILKIS